MLRYGMSHAGLAAVAALIATANLVACGKSSHSSSADGCEGGAGGDSMGGSGGSTPEEVPEELVSLPHVASCPTSVAVDESAIFWIGANADGAIEVARAQYVCLINGAPADCPDYENNATLVRLPLR